MKKKALISSLIVFFAVACGLSFWLGKEIAEKEKNKFIENLSLNALGNTLLVLRYFDENQQGEAQHILQAETSGLLSWLIELDQTNSTPEFLKQRCKVLNTLKQYREKHQLSTSNDWVELSTQPEAKEEEAKRTKYLNDLACGKDVFFKIQSK